MECIRIDDDLHVKLFYKGSPVPLPEWFRKGRDCKLTRKSMLQNLPNYVRIEEEQTSSIFEELKQIQFQKKPRFSSSIIITLYYWDTPRYNHTGKGDRGVRGQNPDFFRFGHKTQQFLCTFMCFWRNFKIWIRWPRICGFVGVGRAPWGVILGYFERFIDNRVKKEHQNVLEWALNDWIWY